MSGGGATRSARTRAAGALAIAVGAWAALAYGLRRAAGDCWDARYPGQGFFLVLFGAAFAASFLALSAGLVLRRRMDPASPRQERMPGTTADGAMATAAAAAGALGIVASALLLLWAVAVWPPCVD